MRASYTSLSDLPSPIPLFPLAGAILLPRATLPLNIFEPRYLAMLDAAMSGTRVIGIIQPTGDGGATGSPASAAAALSRVGCAGRVTSYQEQDDGRLLIVLTGIARFVAGRETTAGTPYRTFAIDYAPFADDIQAGAGEAEVDRDRLLAALKKFLAARQATADWSRIAETGSEQLVNWLSLASPFAPKEKQALLEAPTLQARAETLIALAEMDIAAGSRNEPGSRMQ